MAVRIGKIGIGHAHAVGWTNALRESLEVEFVGIFEPDPETIAVRSQDPAYGGVRWLSEDELPGDRSVQAVFVETRPADNLGWARRALEAGKHISIDMAPSRSLNQLQEEFDLAQLGRMHVNMGYMFRFNPAFQFAFEAVESGLLGERYSGSRPKYQQITGATGACSAAPRWRDIRAVSCMSWDVTLLIWAFGRVMSAMSLSSWK
jgi:predicted dehydrogenase